MANKQFIRDLNSLIRRDDRSRLKLPAERTSITGGLGISDGANEPAEEPELMYIRHYGGGMYNVVYSYDGDGNTPVLIGNAGDRGGLGVHGSDIYGGQILGSQVYKNGGVLFDTGLGNILVAVNSTQIVVQDDLYEAYIYDLTGASITNFQLPIDFAGAQTHTANDEGIGYYYSASGSEKMAICNYSGTRIMSTSYFDFGYSTALGSCKEAFIFVDTDSGYNNYVLKVFNNDGTLIGSHSLPTATLNPALGGDLSAIGITRDRIYIFGASNSTPNCLIYEHSFTMTGDLATASIIGELLYTVATPQTNNMVDSTIQNTAVNSANF